MRREQVYEVNETIFALDMTSFEYQKNMGAYKPRFEGQPDDYHPLTCSEVIGYIIFVVGVIVGALGFMIANLYWAMKHGLEESVIVWSFIFLVFMIFLMIAFYVGGRMRIKEEKRLIVEAQHRQEEMVRQKNANKGRK